ncbi:glutaredoxin family protein [Microbacterium sp. ASV49]|uniref:Glutaredoxin family protein n=1 Tax=Microbacterium candidum TaxID=3041922 RepID=A0ABT7MVY9_9MICO|nr:glutaredoxin family protein [Microbacterium sp. ASV49]MDL9978585.1 glutaredoxin family protein [Microbacterium sp. ASV49]
MITVTVYSTGPQCQRCRLTLRRLEDAGIPFTIVDLIDATSRDARAYVTDDLGYSEAPIVVVDDEPEHHWSGFRPDLIDHLATSIREAAREVLS